VITVLVPADWYLPGWKAGGALRSLAALVAHLRDEFAFRIVTRDHDWTERSPFPGVRPNEWTRVEGADVLYLPARATHPGTLLGILRADTYDVLYLHSLFSGTMTISPLLFRRLGLARKAPVVLAPRGQLSPGALAIRKWKKRSFLVVARWLGLYEDVIWQASTEHEAQDIRHHFERDPTRPTRVVIAPDLAIVDTTRPPSSAKRPGELRAVWLSRITPKKNLLGALDILAGVGAPVRLDIYGLVEDEPHWRECEARIKSLPPEISANYCGVLPYPAVVSTLAKYDLFFFPSLGENFGHVILEALAAGCPVLTSDQTGFRDLTAGGIGWTLPLADVAAFRERIRECIAMGPAERDRIAERAVRFARDYLLDERSVEANRMLFREAAERGRVASDRDIVPAQCRDQNIA
jgi:glycosyltransferase involved in cell wall biosynthesis